MTAPRTDPQSTVPVEPRDLPERVVVGANGAYWRDYGDHYSMCPVSEDNDPVEIVAIYNRSEADATAWDRGFKAGLDAARASQPITATAREAMSSLIRACRAPAGVCRLCGVPASTMHQDDCAVLDAIRFMEPAFDRALFPQTDPGPAALPVREDEPTGIDDWTRLAEAWANVMDGRRIVEHGPRYSTAARIGRDTTTGDDWRAIHDEYDRLTREASHVR